MVTMPDPRRLSPATMLTTDDASPVLSRFSHCSGRKIGVCALLTQKPVLQPVFFIQNILETMTNPFMTLKNRPKTKLNPKQKINSSSDLFFHELLRYKST